MECNCKKNQTHPDVLKDIAQRGLDIKLHEGIGVFLIPAPEIGILEWKTVAVEGISYQECVKRGDNCTSFQWIPKGFVWDYPDRSGKKLKVTIDSKSDLNAISCPPFCQDGWWCPAGCFCNFMKTCQSTSIGN